MKPAKYFVCYNARALKDRFWFTKKVEVFDGSGVLEVKDGSSPNVKMIREWSELLADHIRTEARYDKCRVVIMTYVKMED